MFPARGGGKVRIGSVPRPRRVEAEEAQEPRQPPEVHVEEEPRRRIPRGDVRLGRAHGHLVAVRGTGGSRARPSVDLDAADLGVRDAEILDDRHDGRAGRGGDDARGARVPPWQVLETPAEMYTHPGHRPPSIAR